MAARSEYIYMLVGQLPGCEPDPFYVGRTEREPGVRFNEHVRNAKRGNKRTEAVYQYAHEHYISCGLVLFEEVMLCECKEENPDDYEDFWVIKLIRMGCKLQNMKKGDAKREAAEELARSSEVIESAADVRKYKVRKAEEVAEAHRQKVLAETKGTGKNPRPNKALLAFMNDPNNDVVTANRAKEAKKELNLQRKLAREKNNAEYWASKGFTVVDK